MEEKLNSSLSHEEIVNKIKVFLIKFSQFGIFHNVEIKWEDSFSLRINYKLIKDKEKNHLVEIFIELNDVHSIIIKNEHYFVIQYFLLEFQKIL